MRCVSRRPLQRKSGSPASGLGGVRLACALYRGLSCEKRRLRAVGGGGGRFGCAVRRALARVGARLDRVLARRGRGAARRGMIPPTRIGSQRSVPRLTCEESVRRLDSVSCMVHCGARRSVVQRRDGGVRRWAHGMADAGENVWPCDFRDDEVSPLQGLKRVEGTSLRGLRSKTRSTPGYYRPARRAEEKGISAKQLAGGRQRHSRVEKGIRHGCLEHSFFVFLRVL